jgi:hypothetical protein
MSDNLRGLEHLGPVQEGHTVPVWSDNRPTIAGTYKKTVTLSSEGCMFALWVASCSGSISVAVNTLTTDGKELPLLSFPTLTAGTSQLLLKKASDVLSRIVVIVTIVGTADFDLVVKGTKLGQVSTKDTPASAGRAVKFTAISTPTLLTATSPLERCGLILKNTGPATTVYLGFTLSEASSGNGWPLAIGETIAMSLSNGQSIFAVTDGGTADVRCMEVGS